MDMAAARQQIREKFIADIEKQRQIQRRNRYVSDLKFFFKRHIYEERIKAYNEILERLIQKNSELLGGVSPTFVYQGVMYSAWYYHSVPGSNRLIHPDMLEKIKAHIEHEDFDENIEEGKIMNYIGNALIVARHKNDLFELIPERLCRPLQALNEEIFNIGQPMSNQEVLQFKDENQSGIVAFRRLFLEQLLMA